MAGLFGGKAQLQPLPMAPDTGEAERQRMEAERQAVTQRAAAGRASTQSGGVRQALEERQSRYKGTVG